jgi:hypothetical protein
MDLGCPLQTFSPNWSHNAQNVSICVHSTFCLVTKPFWIKFKVAGANCGKKYGDFGGFMVSGANFFSQFGPIMPKMCPSVSTEHFGKSQSHIGSNSRLRGPIGVNKYGDFGGFMVSGANFFSQFGPIMPKMCPSVSTEHFGRHVTKPYWIKFKVAGANCGKKYGDYGGFMVSALLT